MTTRKAAATAKVLDDAIASKTKARKTSASTRKSAAAAPVTKAPSKGVAGTAAKGASKAPSKRGRTAKQDNDSPRAKSILLTATDDERSSVGSYEYDDGFVVRDRDIEVVEEEPRLTTSRALSRLLTSQPRRRLTFAEDTEDEEMPAESSSSASIRRTGRRAPIDLTEAEKPVEQRAFHPSFGRTFYPQSATPDAPRSSLAATGQATQGEPLLRASFATGQRTIVNHPKAAPIAQGKAWVAGTSSSSAASGGFRATPQRGVPGTVATFNTPSASSATESRMPTATPDPKKGQVAQRKPTPAKLPFGFEDPQGLPDQNLLFFNVGLPTGDFAPNTIVIYSVLYKCLLAVRPTNGATLQKGLPYFGHLEKGDLKQYTKCGRIADDLALPLLPHSALFPDSVNREDLHAGICFAGYVENIDEGVAAIKAQPTRFKELTVIGLTDRLEFFRAIVTLWGNQLDVVQAGQFDCFLFLNVKQSLFKNAMRFNAGESSAVITLLGVASANEYTEAAQYESERCGEGQLELPHELSHWQ
jgi:hypothetical protein